MQIRQSVRAQTYLCYSPYFFNYGLSDPGPLDREGASVFYKRADHPAMGIIRSRSPRGQQEVLGILIRGVGADVAGRGKLRVCAPGAVKNGVGHGTRVVRADNGCRG